MSETAIVGLISQAQVPKILFSITCRGGISYRVVLLKRYCEQARRGGCWKGIAKRLAVICRDFGGRLFLVEKIMFECPKRPLSA